MRFCLGKMIYKELKWTGTWVLNILLNLINNEKEKEYVVEYPSLFHWKAHSLPRKIASADGIVIKPVLVQADDSNLIIDINSKMKFKIRMALAVRPTCLFPALNYLNSSLLVLLYVNNLTTSISSEALLPFVAWPKDRRTKYL